MIFKEVDKTQSVESHPAPHLGLESDNTKLRMIAEGLSRGDQRAWEELYLLMFDPIVIFISRVLKSHDEALDIAQDVFVTLWQNAPRIDPSRSLKSYLYVIARNHTFKYLRSRSKVLGDSSLSHCGDLGIMDFSPDDIVIAEETKLLIAMVLESMQPQRRQVFKMCRYEGKTVDQIASTLKINRRTVQNHIYNATKEIRQTIIITTTIFGAGIFTL